MLDEIRELGLYTFDPDDDASFPRAGTILRLFKKNRKNDFACVPHALEMVARQSLFYGGVSAEEATLRADETMDVLRNWCGFAGKEATRPSVPGLEGCQAWMKRYIGAYSRLFPGSDSRTLMDAWNGHKKGYARALFGEQSLTASDANDVSYEAAIARAIRKGPLKRWVMAGKLVPEEVCMTPRERKDGSYAKLNAANGPTVLMLTGMCLKGLGGGNGVPESGFVPINLQELCGWLGRSKEFDHAILESWLYEGEQLFVQDRERSGVKSWMVSQAWLDDGQWQLIDVTDSDEPLRAFWREHENEGFRYYFDAEYTDPSFEMGLLKSLVAVESLE